MAGRSRGSIGAFTKLVYASGDHTVNLGLSALSLLLFTFLIQYAGLRPSLAGAVFLIARFVDAVTDPAMGRISDLTRWKAGRRRPYFLVGMIPFGVFFALLWVVVPGDSQLAKFAYYTTVYIGISLSMTVLSVPYLALLPEMAQDYDERTSLNTFRSAGAVLGTFAAVAMKPLADALGGPGGGFTGAGAIMAVWLVLPWIAVFRVTWEDPSLTAPAAPMGIVEGVRTLFEHDAYRVLSGFYIAGRIAVDLVGAMFLPFFTYWLGRPGDFEWTLGLFLGVVVLSLPFWLRIARSTDKRTIFVVGCVWWIVAQLVMFTIGPDWPRSAVFAVAGLAAVGYAVADLMPWAMLGEVIDEDELLTGERREGVYTGFFTFLRKLGGASAVFLAGQILDLAGFVKDGQQTEGALLAIRLLTTVVPALFLVVAVAFAFGYRLSRTRHVEILRTLETRRATTA